MSSRDDCSGTLEHPDAFAELVGAFANAGPDAGRSEVADIAALLAKVPHDNPEWLRDSDFALRDPEGGMSVKGNTLEQNFVGRVKDLGELLNFVQVRFDDSSAHSALGGYNLLARSEIQSAKDHGQAEEWSSRLGLLGAAVTESVNVGLAEEFNDQSEEAAGKEGVVNFFLDQAIGKIPDPTGVVTSAARELSHASVKDYFDEGSLDINSIISRLRTLKVR